jgi:polyisoprenoid-binding protein YceI
VVDEEFFADALTKYGIAVGAVNTIGSTQEIAGQLQLNLDDLSAPIGENRFTVQVNTLSSDQSLRDGWIKENGPRFNSYPLAEFVATGVEGAPASYTEGQEVQFQMPGNLTVRGITQPATFDVTAKLQDGTINGTATARLLMSDFGIEPPNFLNTLKVGDEFELQVEIAAREQ